MNSLSPAGDWNPNWPEPLEDLYREVLPPKTATELEDELSKAHAMLGRALLLLVTRTDLTGAEIGAAIIEPDDD